MTICAAPLSFDTLVAYWAGDLSPARLDEVEEHLFACDDCTRASARIAAITEHVRGLLPPVLTRAQVADLRARGLRVADNVVTTSTRSHVTFRTEDVLIQHLSGLHLENAARVGVTVRVEESGELLIEQPAAPFDADAGELLLVCQRHFAVFPPNVVFVVKTTDHDGAERTDRFVVEHTFV